MPPIFFLRNYNYNYNESCIYHGYVLYKVEIIDNARPHTNLLTREAIATIGWTVLSHPPYSPDLAPSDFHLFVLLKDALRGRRFADDDELKHSVSEELRRFSKEFYATGIQHLTQRWGKYVDNEGDCLEE
jgi:histone-lysine N-methyltransferase SETMAR